jgi:hypothetical protein
MAHCALIDGGYHLLADGDLAHNVPLDILNPPLHRCVGFIYRLLLRLPFFVRTQALRERPFCHSTKDQLAKVPISAVGQDGYDV